MNYNSIVYDAAVMFDISYSKVNVIVIGTQQHSSDWWRNIDPLGLNPVAGVGRNSKLMFVHQAIRTIRLGLIYKWIVLLCSEGYTENQLEHIKETVTNITNKAGEKIVLNCHMISSLDDIISYINSLSAKKQKIETLYFYAHGVVKEILPWMKLKKGIPIDENFFKKLKKESFVKGAVVKSYACRTGLGNPNIDQDRIIKKEGKTSFDRGEQYIIELPLLLLESLASRISAVLNVTVYAYLRRTEYSDTLFTSDEYDFLDACDAALLNNKRSRKASKYDHITQTRQLTRTERDRYKKLNEERDEKKNIIVDNASFRLTGAFHPVRAARTPRNVSSSFLRFYKL